MSESSFTVNCTLQWPYHVEISKKQKIFVTALERENMQLNSSERESRKNYKCAISPIIQLFFFLFKFHIYIFLYSPCSLPLGRARSGAHAALSPSVQERITRNVSRSSDRFPPYVLTFVGWINPRPRT